VRDERFLSLAQIDKLYRQPYNENNGQRKRYKRHFADISVTPATVINAFAIADAEYLAYILQLLLGALLKAEYLRSGFFGGLLQKQKRVLTHYSGGWRPI